MGVILGVRSMKREIRDTSDERRISGQTAIETALGMVIMAGFAIVFLHIFFDSGANDLNTVELMWNTIEHTITAPYP